MNAKCCYFFVLDVLLLQSLLANTLPSGPQQRHLGARPRHSMLLVPTAHMLVVHVGQPKVVLRQGIFSHHDCVKLTISWPPTGWHALFKEWGLVVSEIKCNSLVPRKADEVKAVHVPEVALINREWMGKCGKIWNIKSCCSLFINHTYKIKYNK